MSRWNRKWTRRAKTAEPAAPTNIDVLVYAEPATAVAVVDGQEVKLPETFQVITGVDFALEVRAKGYVTREIVLDGTQAKVQVKLDKGAGTAGPRPPIRPHGKGKGTATKPKGGGDIVEPW